MNKLIYLLLPLCSLSTYSYAGGSLDISFMGNLVSTGCKLPESPYNLEVQLNKISSKYLYEYGRSQPVDFSIPIVDCYVSDLNKTISIKLNSNILVTDKGTSYLKTEGGSNVLLGLLDNNDTVIKFNEKIDMARVLVTGQNEQNLLNFKVYARPPVTGDLKEGAFSSTITFNIDYQ